MKIEPAEHIKSISEYYFSVKLAEVARMNAEGQDIISLAVGAPDHMPSQRTIDTLCETARRSDVHAYQPYSGIPELRKAYADWYKRVYDVEITSNEVLPLIGSKEDPARVHGLFELGDEVLVPNPGYPPTRRYQAAARKVIQYDLLEDKNWEPDFEALEKRDLSKVNSCG